MLGNCIILMQSKIYVVGFFYSLNARQRLTTGHQSVTVGDMGIIDPVVFSERRAATIIVEQETEMHVMVSPPVSADRSMPRHPSPAPTARSCSRASSPRRALPS